MFTERLRAAHRRDIWELANMKVPFLEGKRTKQKCEPLEGLLQYEAQPVNAHLTTGTPQKKLRRLPSVPHRRSLQRRDPSRTPGSPSSGLQRPPPRRWTSNEPATARHCIDEVYVSDLKPAFIPRNLNLGLPQNGCGSKNRNSEMGCPCNWVSMDQNLRFAPPIV